MNTANTKECTNLPPGWTPPDSGGLNLVTQEVVDALGRTTQETSPGGNVTYWVYLDPQYEVRVYNGWSAGMGTPVRPGGADGHPLAGGLAAAATKRGPRLIPPTVPEVQKQLLRAAWGRPTPAEQAPA